MKKAAPWIASEIASASSPTALFALPDDHAVRAYLADKGLSYDAREDLVLRRSVNADGRSRAFVNDQATSVGVLRDLGAMLVEVHGQHETVGLLDVHTHRSLLDAFGRTGAEAGACAEAWSAWRAARVDPLIAACSTVPRALRSAGQTSSPRFLARYARSAEFRVSARAASYASWASALRPSRRSRSARTAYHAW